MGHWGLAHPYVEILGFTGVEEETIVAVLEFSQFVELVQFRFRIEFRYYDFMEGENRGHWEGVDVYQFGARVPRYLLVSHTSRSNDQNSLLNLLLTIESFRSRRSRPVCFAERLINCTLTDTD